MLEEPSENNTCLLPSYCFHEDSMIHGTNLVQFFRRKIRTGPCSVSFLNGFHTGSFTGKLNCSASVTTETRLLFCNGTWVKPVLMLVHTCSNPNRPGMDGAIAKAPTLRSFRDSRKAEICRNGLLPRPRPPARRLWIRGCMSKTEIAVCTSWLGGL